MDKKIQKEFNTEMFISMSKVGQSKVSGGSGVPTWSLTQEQRTLQSWE